MQRFAIYALRFVTFLIIVAGYLFVYHYSYKQKWQEQQEAVEYWKKQPPRPCSDSDNSRECQMRRIPFPSK